MGVSKKRDNELFETIICSRPEAREDRIEAQGILKISRTRRGSQDLVGFLKEKLLALTAPITNPFG